ncbi:MAG TPA: heme-binding protein [Bryobacteraceae bacterium]|nr:heme-binding protein [Bryobacteraceae bacterium]
MKKALVMAAAAMAVFSLEARGADCSSLLTVDQMKSLLSKAPNDGGDEGGLFHGKREWAVVVNRQGQVCGVAASTGDPTQVWPGSLAIAKAKAYTANAFSLDSMPLSTARLYTLTQPGHSLWGIASSNPFVAGDLVPPSEGPGSSTPRVEGGLIAFGGGLPLYRNGKIIGALGVSGDTACTDHETAKRMRNEAGLNPPGGMHVDDITFPSVDGPSVFSHPLCQNTYRDGKFLGNEAMPTFDQNMGQPQQTAGKQAPTPATSKK